MNEFLTQSQLAERLVQKTGIKPETAKQFSTVFFTVVKKGLKNSETFSIYNFGTFKKTWIEATTGLNPSNGEKINIPAHWRIKFIPCQTVARRLNRPYAHLKAKEITDDTILPVPVVPQDEDDYDDDLHYEEKEVSKRNLKVLALAGIGLLLLILLVSLLLKGCTSKKAEKKSKDKPMPENSSLMEEAAAAEKAFNETQDMEISSPEAEEQADFDAACLMFTEFAVPDGSDYHTIAEEKYGNRHMWPVIYAANKNLSCDPDFVAKYCKIKIPELPAAGPEQDKAVENCVLEAYNGYLLMCEKEPENPKNAERQRLATRVLVSGELLVPGFIAEYRNRILPDYAAMATNIVLH